MAHTQFTRLTNFEAKDGLTSGSALKRVKGVEIEDEFANAKTAIDAKSDLNSPSFTGAPTVPTATAGSATTQAANTSFVDTAVTNGITAHETANPIGVSGVTIDGVTTVTETTVFINDSAPTVSDGNDGDVWFEY